MDGFIDVSLASLRRSRATSRLRVRRAERFFCGNRANLPAFCKPNASITPNSLLTVDTPQYITWKSRSSLNLENLSAIFPTQRQLLSSLRRCSGEARCGGDEDDDVRAVAGFLSAI